MEEWTKLPPAFEEQMKELLGEEYKEYLTVRNQKPESGLRYNRRKITQRELEKGLPFPLRPIPWISNGYTYGEEFAASRDPYYYAGLYYLQEPSAMTPASRLPVLPGDYVLDLCAAPGGKATELGARLEGRGVLVANDISVSRGRALLKNLELAGIPNIYVTGEDPRRLREAFPGFFDKILVDAPCSGEGMFRKDPKMIRFWETQGPEYYSGIQRELVRLAADMLRPGGMLLYSTCTFSMLENEGTVGWLLQERQDMELIPMEWYEGFAPGRQGLPQCVRIFPHKMKGEGHFLALLKKRGEAPPRRVQETVSDSIGVEAERFLKRCGIFSEDTVITRVKDRLYARGARDGMPAGLRYLRTGLYLGECRKNRFEPSQALAMALSCKTFAPCLCLNREDPRVLRYLKGETLDVADMASGNGWVLVCVDTYPLGWGKVSGGILKNKYSSGWRMQ